MKENKRETKFRLPTSAFSLCFSPAPLLVQVRRTVLKYPENKKARPLSYVRDETSKNPALPPKLAHQKWRTRSAGCVFTTAPVVTGGDPGLAYHLYLPSVQVSANGSRVIFNCASASPSTKRDSLQALATAYSFFHSL